MSDCAYCGKPLKQMACKGRDDQLYCSSVCCEMGNPPEKRLHGRLPKPIVLKMPKPQWWVCCMHGGGHFMVQGNEQPSGRIVGENFTIAPDSYDVVYGPCSYTDGEDYMDDVSGVR